LDGPLLIFSFLCVSQKSKMVTIAEQSFNIVKIFHNYSHLKPMNHLKVNLAGMCL